MKTFILVFIIITSVTSGCKMPEKNPNSLNLEDVVNKWNNAHNNKEVGILDDLYADEVQFYLKKLQKNECLEEKLKLFKRFPAFFQQINGKIEIENLPDSCFKMVFLKSVTINEETKDYPSYLVINKNGKILVESDLVTESRKLKLKMADANTSSNNSERLFIVGANGGIAFDFETVLDGVVYKPMFPAEVIAPVKINIFFNQILLDITAEYKNGQTVKLPYEFELGYDDSNTEILVEKKTNKYFIGQYDFDGDGIDEIVFAVKDNGNVENGIGVCVLKYFPPSTENNVYREENWELLGKFSAGYLYPCEGLIKEKSIRFDRGLRGFYYEWTFVKGKFIDTGDY